MSWLKNIIILSIIGGGFIYVTDDTILQLSTFLLVFLTTLIIKVRFMKNNLSNNLHRRIEYLYDIGMFDHINNMYGIHINNMIDSSLKQIPKRVRLNPDKWVRRYTDFKPDICSISQDEIVGDFCLCTNPTVRHVVSLDSLTKWDEKSTNNIKCPIDRKYRFECVRYHNK